MQALAQLQAQLHLNAAQMLVGEATLRKVNGREVHAAVQASGPEVLLTAKFEKCLKRFADLPLNLPQKRVTDHTIELEAGLKQPAHRIVRLSPKEMADLKSHLDRYLSAGQIEPAKSPHVLGVLFAKKKMENDGTMRMCVDYWALNKITKNDMYLLPRRDPV